MMDLQHNLVSLLYAIKGMTECHLGRVEDGRFQDETEALRHASLSLRKIHVKAAQSMRVAKRISLIMKEKAQPDPAKSKTLLTEAWQEAVEFLSEHHPLSRAEIIQHIPAELPPLQCAKRDLIEILFHLTQNALQAMKGRGKVILRANLALTSENAPVASIVLADTGPGIAPNLLGSLFEPFYTTKPIDRANGLGLCLVKSLVRRNRGRIAVSSFEGFGTTFTLSFPLAGEHDSAARKAA